MKRIISLLIGFLTVCSMLIGATGFNYSSSYHEFRNVKNFTSIEAAGSAEIIFTPSDRHEVVVEGDEDAVKNYLTECSDGKLRLYFKNNNRRISVFGIRIAKTVNSGHVRVRICAPGIKSISMAGSGDLTVTDIWATDDRVSVSVSGSGNMDFNSISASDLTISTAGSGCVTVKRADILKETILSTSGSGYIHISGSTDYVSARTSGSGNISGNLFYNNIESRSSGSGKISFSK